MAIPSITGNAGQDIGEFRLHFDDIYLGCIPRLLDEKGMFLAFLAFVTALDVLAGVYFDDPTPKKRFIAFTERFLPSELRTYSLRLWKARNLMVHSFNPGGFGLVSGQSRLHLFQNDRIVILNAQDIYAALVIAAAEYFRVLQSDSELQEIFKRRLLASSGGAPEMHVLHEY